MDIVDKAAAHLWGTRMQKQGDAHEAAQRLADAGLLRQPNQPVVTVNVRIPAADDRPPIGLVVDEANGVVNWEGLNYYSRPDDEADRSIPDGRVLIVCEHCPASHRFTRLPGPFDRAEIDAARWSSPRGDDSGDLVCPECGDA